MINSNVREAIETLSTAIAADPAKARTKAAPATARLIDGLQCEVTGPRANADADTLRQLVAWAEAHSPVGCTVKDGPPCSLDIQVV